MESSQIKIRAINKNPLFNLNEGTQLIRNIHRQSLKNPSKITIKSCEFYLKDRNNRKQTTVSTNLTNKKSNNSQTLSPGSVFRSVSLDIYQKSFPNTQDSKTTQILGPFIQRFLIQNTGKFLKPLPLMPSKPMSRSFSEDIFKKLQSSISSELEKSANTQKIYEGHLKAIKSLKKITDQFGKFKPTKFELEVLGHTGKQFEIHPFSRFRERNPKAKTRAQLINSKIIALSKSLEKYREIYRQFNKSSYF